MSAKKIFTIGFHLAYPDSKAVKFNAKTSLLDWDIVLFKPEIHQYVDRNTRKYKGKPSLSESASFEMAECCEHWRREILQAYNAGKTVIIFLSKLFEVFVDSGNREYSGTGRNQITTELVEPFHNYRAIPIDYTPVASSGSDMKLSSQFADILGTYWTEFEKFSTYEVVLAAQPTKEAILTRSGDKTVGSLARSKTSCGSLLLLPNIDFSDAQFFEVKDGTNTWSAFGKQFASKLVTAVVTLDKSLRTTSNVTPAPTWAVNQAFLLEPEIQLRVQLLEIERAVEVAQKKKEQISNDLNEAGKLRALLYEKGKPLEEAIILALQTLGFTASSYKDSNSEFDVVFESEEGRLIGEAEGKDTKPVNVEKLRQLGMNVQEDMQREKVSAQAKPVLFGNGNRFLEPKHRPDPFTVKCYSAAQSSSTALIATADLFEVVQYLIKKSDVEYARQIREKILGTVGRIIFPAPPDKSLIEEIFTTSE